MNTASSRKVTLQQILGHKQIGLTVDLYGGLRARDLKEVSPYGF